METLISRVEDYFRRKPVAMTLAAARDLGVPEAEVIRALEGKGGTELDPAAFEPVIRALEAFGTCHVIVSNRGATLECRGAFGNFSRTGPFFNVETPTLDMHLRPEAVGSLFCVEKRGHADGKPIRMVQCYDRQGDSIMKAVVPAGQEAGYEALRARHALRQEAKA